MGENLTLEAPPGTSLKSLVSGFVLTKNTEGKSPRTVEYYRENLRRFLWYAEKHSFPDDIRMIDEWKIRSFLGYVRNEKNRWGAEGNGSESSSEKSSNSTVYHYYVAIACFFNWVVAEGFMKVNPMAKVKVSKPKNKVMAPYTVEEINKMLAVCDSDYALHAKFLGSRNRAIVLVLLDTGVRLSELLGMKLNDLDNGNGCIKVLGKGSKERMVRMGKVTQKAVWKYLMHRPKNERPELWLTEEYRVLNERGVQCMVKRLLGRAKITSTGSVHKFRHTFALNFLRADKNVFNLQYLLGHSQLEMVKRYTSALGMEDALKAHEKASPADVLGIK